MLKIQALALHRRLQASVRRAHVPIMKIIRANLRSDRKRLEPASHAEQDRVSHAEKLIPVVELKGRETFVRLLSRSEADRLEAAGEVMRQSGLVVRRTR
jgi:hypothetical protein